MIVGVLAVLLLGSLVKHWRDRDRLEGDPGSAAAAVEQSVAEQVQPAREHGTAKTVSIPAKKN